MLGKFVDETQTIPKPKPISRVATPIEHFFSNANLRNSSPFFFGNFLLWIITQVFYGHCHLSSPTAQRLTTESPPYPALIQICSKSYFRIKFMSKIYSKYKSQNKTAKIVLFAKTIFHGCSYVFDNAL